MDTIEQVVKEAIEAREKSIADERVWQEQDEHSRDSYQMQIGARESKIATWEVEIDSLSDFLKKFAEMEK